MKAFHIITISSRRLIPSVKSSNSVARFCVAFGQLSEATCLTILNISTSHFTSTPSAFEVILQ